MEVTIQWPNDRRTAVDVDAAFAAAYFYFRAPGVVPTVDGVKPRQLPLFTSSNAMLPLATGPLN